jgi:PKD repeat protein
MRYYWDFNDGRDQVNYENHTTHKFIKPGLFQVELTVFDLYDRNKTASDVIITVKNRPPEARIRPLSIKHVGWSVVLSGAESVDRDGRIVQYIWSFGDGSEPLKTNLSKVEHTWTKGGVYTVQLTIQDNHGSTANTFMTIIIEEEEEKSIDFGFITVIIIIVLFNIITITTLVKLIALLRARNISKNKSKNRKGGFMG